MTYQQLLDEMRELCPDVDFETEEALIDDGLLDSFDVVTLVAQIAGEYDIRIPASKLVPENFNSAKALFALITSLDED